MVGSWQYFSFYCVNVINCTVNVFNSIETRVKHSAILLTTANVTKILLSITFIGKVIPVINISD